jgi:uncharacterized phiE125 gp8 family phage protein
MLTLWATTGILGSTPTPPPAPSLSLDGLKNWLRYEADDTDQDGSLALMLRAAIAHVEKQTGRLFTRRTVSHPVTTLRGPVPLLYGPITGAVTLSYSDIQGDAQTGEFDRFDGARLIAPAGGWPLAYAPIVATYQAGYAEPEDVPEDLLVAVLLLAGNWDKNREGTVNGANSPLMLGVEALISSYRTYWA